MRAWALSPLLAAGIGSLVAAAPAPGAPTARCPSHPAHVLARSPSAYVYARTQGRSPLASLCVLTTGRARSLGTLTSRSAVALRGDWLAWGNVRPASEGRGTMSFVSLASVKHTTGIQSDYQSDPTIRHAEGTATGDHLAVPTVVVSAGGVAAWTVCKPRDASKLGALNECAPGRVVSVFEAEGLSSFTSGPPPKPAQLASSRAIDATSLRLTQDGRHVTWLQAHRRRQATVG